MAARARRDCHGPQSTVTGNQNTSFYNDTTTPVMAAAAAADKVLISTHISDVYSPLQAATISIQTSKPHVPLPPHATDDEPPPEHAQYASFFHSVQTGVILLRLIHNGLIIELISLSTETPPVRFVFPYTILPNPALILWETRELHILAATASGSLYRIIVPLQTPQQLWSTHMVNNWCREYHLKNVQDSLQALVQVQGAHSVAFALTNGSLIRLDAETIGDDFTADHWTESLFHHNTFLGSLTSFLHQGSGDGSHIVATACHPQPTDIGHVWTLSRDRTLRLWTARSGCASAKSLPSSASSCRELSPGASTSTNRSNILLDPVPQKLITVYEGPFVIVFIPTPSSSSSGGFFQLFSASNDHLQLVETFEASHESAHGHLQDFAVINGYLHTLWDRQSQAAVDILDVPMSDVSNEPESFGWRVALYPYEPDLTPAYLDELLLSPGSLTDKFFSAIMRPGVFSSHTLRTAIGQYTDACRSLPGPPTAPLITSYISLGEQIAAVVGCTVTLSRDTHTGALQYDKYWIALKRDWEGFIARCRAVERSARWPLALGTGRRGEVLIAERERIGTLAVEDLPLRLHRHFRADLGAEPQFAGRVIDLTQQEIAFPFADIIADTAARGAFRDSLDDGAESWLVGRLQSVPDLEAATRLVLDLVGGFDRAVKMEEDEVELLLPQHISMHTRMLTAAYATHSVEARYDFILALIALLFFFSEDLEGWDPSLLAEIFAVFRGVAMLRYAAEQPAFDAAPFTIVDDADEVTARLRTLGMSRSGPAASAPMPDLFPCLLEQIGGAAADAPLAVSAHAFLDMSGLLQATSTAHAARLEVLWCEHLRSLRFLDAARETLEWLPRTPAVMYVWARLWLDVGRGAEAAEAMDKLAGSFGPHSALSFEDADALGAVLPGGQLFDSLALLKAPLDWDTTDLWSTVIRGATDLGYWDDAYAALMSTPHDVLRRDCAQHLVHRMCEEHVIERLMSFNFVGIVDEVEASLSFKARNADPRVQPFYSRILYTWYVTHGDYRNAALAMYQRARKLAVLGNTNEPTQYFALAEQQLEALVISSNALALLDQRDAWITFPLAPEGQGTRQLERKRRKLTKHIPEDKFSGGKRDLEIVKLSDVIAEYTFLSAQLDLVRKDPELLRTSATIRSPESVVLRLVQSNRFNLAMATARTLGVDLTDLFSHLTRQCLRLSHSPDTALSEDMTDWLLTDKVTSWTGTPSDRGWRYLRQSLERHDGPDTDLRYSKVVFETITGLERASTPPPWLIHRLEAHHSEWLVRAYYLVLRPKAELRLSQDPPKAAMSTWLPYTLIDQLLVATNEQTQSGLSKRAIELRRDLHREVSNGARRHCFGDESRDVANSDLIRHSSSSGP
ncbi:nucleoporin Nup120/160-domain-containing protein [Multifurca ochricompacta]|uniref:Nucleoporin Nup120/160-domain-containing protein n=1 Tax=Multifurca ochricompacta TaxID=376703 RepID=A0AAD4MD24_9AGAM|nr:nucleoporin Nup120/160-domain-containing protein [Multifurca ochricompacta]